MHPSNASCPPFSAGLLTPCTQAPPALNDWVLTEDLLLFHRAALQAQLEQAYVGLGLAAATGRAFVLPPLACFCHQAEGGAAALLRCRRKGADAAQFPEPCPAADVLAPLPDFAADPATRGTPLAVVEPAAAEGIPEVGGSAGWLGGCPAHGLWRRRLQAL